MICIYRQNSKCNGWNFCILFYICNLLLPRKYRKKLQLIRKNSSLNLLYVSCTHCKLRNVLLFKKVSKKGTQSLYFNDRLNRWLLTYPFMYLNFAIFLTIKCLCTFIENFLNLFITVFKKLCFQFNFDSKYNFIPST